MDALSEKLDKSLALQMVEGSGDIQSAVVHLFGYAPHLDVDCFLACRVDTVSLEEACDAFL